MLRVFMRSDLPKMAELLIYIHKTCILAAHNPEAAGSSPVSATTTRSVFIGKQDGFFTYTEFMKKQAEAFASACALTKVTQLSHARHGYHDGCVV